MVEPNVSTNWAPCAIVVTNALEIVRSFRFVSRWSVEKCCSFGAIFRDLFPHLQFTEQTAFDSRWNQGRPLRSHLPRYLEAVLRLIAPQAVSATMSKASAPVYEKNGVYNSLVRKFARRLNSRTKLATLAYSLVVIFRFDQGRRSSSTSSGSSDGTS